MPVPRVSLIVPVYNRSCYTRVFCLALRHALAASEVACEVVVVDNGSSDDTAQVLAQLGDGARVVTLDTNRDFAGGCNAGAAASRGELLLFVNNDTVPLPGFVSPMVRIVDADDEVAIVGSKLLYPDGRIQHAGVAFDRTLAPIHLYRFFSGDHPPANRRRELQAVTGASLLIRRREFEAVGGFDTVYRNSFEDVDLCLRIKTRGGKIVYCPESVLYHFVSVSEGRLDHDVDNFTRFWTRWYPHVTADAGAIYRADGRRGVPSDRSESGEDWVDLLTATRRRAAGWEARARAAERALALGSGADPGTNGGSDRRWVLRHVDCPEAMICGSHQTVTAWVVTGGVSSPVELECRWEARDGAGEVPAATRIASPSATAGLTARVPVQAPSAPGRYDIVLSARAGDGEPLREAWRSMVEVRPLYDATYRAEVPASAGAGSKLYLKVVVTNRGLLPWEGGLFRLSYHWHAEDGVTPVLWDGRRTPIRPELQPGESAIVRAEVEVLDAPGRYVLAWDVVEEGVTWLSHHGVPTTPHAIDVYAAPATPPAAGASSYQQMQDRVAHLEERCVWLTELAGSVDADPDERS